MQLKRWWTYQAERFPVFGHGPLVLAFSSSAVCFSALLTDRSNPPGWPAFLVAFVTCLLFFLQLRIADEFKDFEEDSTYRPYRAVPRGLVSLDELRWVFIIAAVIQLALALWLHPPLVWILFVGWIYLFFMSVEFFVREWITARPITYLWTHMLIMPIVDFYATSCHWMPNEGRPPSGLFWFLVVSFLNGIVIEMGRKIRTPEQEEEGVRTYTVLWGIPRAPWVWFAFVVATAAAAVMAMLRIRFVFGIPVLLLLVIAAGALTWQFVRTRSGKLAKRFELAAGLWTVCLYLLLGLVPYLLTQ